MPYNNRRPSRYANSAGGRPSSSYARPASSPYARGRTSSYQTGQQRVINRRPGGIDTINVKMIIVSAIIGIILWLLCALIYNALDTSVPRALLIGIIFGILSLGVSIVVYITSTLGGTYSDDILGGSTAITLLALVVGSAVIFGVAIFFQWLYGLNFSQAVSMPTSYIFVIDDSGSMSVNDPTDLRYSSILEVMDDMPRNFPYMVYNFTTSAYVVRDMGPRTDDDSFGGRSDGNTDIKGTLTEVMEDYKAGKWDGGDNPKVLLLSDGESAGSYTRILNEYEKNGIAISTVGFGEANDQLMEQIASRTGGVYINVDDISTLAQAIQQATGSSATRDLVSARAGVRLGALYGFLRVLFLAILGFGIGFLALIAYGRNDSTELTMLSSGITALVGALVMEIGTAVGAPATIMWALLWVLIALLICSYKRYYSHTASSAIGGQTL